MVCQTRKPKQQTFPISFRHPIGSVMSLLSQLLYESSKTEQVKKRGGKIFQPKKKKKKSAQRGRKKVCGRLWWRCVGGVGGVPEASNWIREISPTARDVRDVWSEHGMEEHGRTSRGALLFIISCRLNGAGVMWEPDSLRQRWPPANPLCRVFHNKRALTKKVRLVAEWRAFDRPVNRYK